MGCALLVARRQSAELFAAIDEALDPVAETREGSIERPGATFVPLARHGDPNPMLARLVPNLPAAGPCIASGTVGAVPGAAWPTSLDGTSLQELLDDHGLVSLSRGEDEGQQLAAPFGPQMACGIEPAPAPASGVGRWGPCFAPAAC
jgi:hypothetical protein